MDLNDCFNRKLIRKTKIDLELVESLFEMSDIKEKAVNTAKISQENISAYVSLAYDSLREFLEGICVNLGYKVLSHICIGELLKRELSYFDYGEFDRLRYIRNSINYYGVKIEFNQGKEIIKKIFALKVSLKKKI